MSNRKAYSPYRLRVSWRSVLVAVDSPVPLTLNCWRATIWNATGSGTAALLDGISCDELFFDGANNTTPGRLVVGGLRDHEGRAIYLNQTVQLVATGPNITFAIQEEWLDTDSAANTGR